MAVEAKVMAVIAAAMVTAAMVTQGAVTMGSQMAVGKVA